MSLFFITFFILFVIEYGLFHIFKNKVNSWAFNMNKNFHGEHWVIVAFIICLNAVLSFVIYIINFLLLLFNLFN